MKYVTSIERMAEARGAKSKEVEIAINLLKENIQIETIARTTGLTIEQIQQLQAQSEQN